jgi:hypothetical protein
VLLTSADTMGSASLRGRALRTAMSGVMAASAVFVLIVATGCGGSSKPSYCSDRSNLETAVKDLPNSVSSGGANGLAAQVTTVQSDVTTLVNSAKSDFPSETTAIKTSIDSLKTAVQALPSNPTTSDLVPIAAGATAVVNAVKAFDSATKSKCD